MKLASGCQPCDCCGEPWCVEHDDHYADCACTGPHEWDERRRARVAFTIMVVLWIGGCVCLTLLLT